MRKNKIRIKGVVPAEPIIIKDEEKEEYYARSSAVLSRGLRKVENGVKVMLTDRPAIITRDVILVNQLENIHQYDIVDIDGVVTTKFLSKVSYCTQCGEKNKVDGAIIYVTPISIEKCGHVDDKNKAIQYLSTIRQTSNQVELRGRLTRDPKRLKTKSGLNICQYQIEVNRLFFVKGDMPEITSDYIWIKSYGSHAEEDRNRLMMNSIVDLDGYFQTRNVKRKSICSCCGCEYEWMEKTTEVVPYDIEYLKQYRTDEDIEAIKKARQAQAFRDVFGEDFITDDDVNAGIGSFEE